MLQHTLQNKLLWLKRVAFGQLFLFVKKVFFDKLPDFREMYKMTFSLPRRRTKVLREGKKGQNNVKIVQGSMPCTIFLCSILFFCFGLLRCNLTLLFLCVYRQSERVAFGQLFFYFILTATAVISSRQFSSVLRFARRTIWQARSFILPVFHERSSSFIQPQSPTVAPSERSKTISPA